MKPDFLLCDRCGEVIKTQQRLFVAYDRRLDAAGSYDDVGHNVDLCGVCWRWVAGKLSQPSCLGFRFGEVLFKILGRQCL
jgi:hypothetical protein